MYINCGGEEVPFERETYEKDDDKESSKFFIATSDKWAYSSTGVFLGRQDNDLVAKTTSSLNSKNEEIYQTARLAPISLKYYGFCSRKGPYNVRLYFAEIMFSNDQKFNSLGKRLFDVAIQVSEKYQFHFLYSKHVNN